MELATIHRPIFTEGIPWLGLDGGPQLEHNEAFSFQIATDDQGKIAIAAIEAARRG